MSQKLLLWGTGTISLINFILFFNIFPFQSNKGFFSKKKILFYELYCFPVFSLILATGVLISQRTIKGQFRLYLIIKNNEDYNKPFTLCVTMRIRIFQ